MGSQASEVQVKALQDWFIANGGVLHPNVCIQSATSGCVHPDSGVHLCAFGPVLADSPIVSAPHCVTLSCLNALVDTAFPVFANNKDQFETEALGFWYLMTQWVNRETSFWKPYLDTLPSPESELTQPMFFDKPEHIDLLAGTDVWATVQAREKVYQQFYEEGLTILANSGIDTIPYTWHLFKWAVAMFSSRSFSSGTIRPRPVGNVPTMWVAHTGTEPGSRKAQLVDMSGYTEEDFLFPVLFPGLDAGNHDHSAKAKWHFNREEFVFALGEGQIQPGSEVFNNYGPKPNGELLIGYGFCIPNNEHDVIGLTPRKPSDDLRENLRKACQKIGRPEQKWMHEAEIYHLERIGDLPDPHRIFHKIPVALLELLICLLLHQYGHECRFILNPAEWLSPKPSDDQTSDGAKYSLHVSGLFLNYLRPKFKVLLEYCPEEPPDDSVRAKQAFMYRSSQIELYEQWTNAFTTYINSFTSEDGISEWCAKPPGLKLLNLYSFHALLITHDIIDETFMRGIAATAGTDNTDILWAAEWEDEIFVLLICYALFQPNITLPKNAPIRNALKEYEELYPEPLELHVPAEPPADPDPRDEEGLQVCMELIKKGVRVCGRQSTWAHPRWRKEYLRAVGAYMRKINSFWLVEDMPQEAAEAIGLEPPPEQMERQYLALYLQDP